MQLTKKQEEGLNIALKKFRQREPYVVIAGFAGSGKSFLASYIRDALFQEGVKEQELGYATFTGKASQVLMRRGNKNCSTLHKLLFHNIMQRDGSFLRVKVKSIPYRVLIVDECSMVLPSMVEHLMNLNCFVIYLGDPFQLPPVKKDADNHLLDKPDIFLDEIMRQAKESEIIRLSMDIREQNSIKIEDYHKDVLIKRKKELVTGMYEWADQILCATNGQRRVTNNQIRSMKGFEGVPQKGDKVICTENNWEIVSNIGNGLTNGTIGYIKNIFDSEVHFPYYLQLGKKRTLPIWISDIEMDYDENEYFENLNFDQSYMFNEERCFSGKEMYKIRRNNKTRNLIPIPFTYGYCITVHKAQGSEWDKVLVLEENFPYSGLDHRRWLYTAITRASDKLVWVKKD